MLKGVEGTAWLKSLDVSCAWMDSDSRGGQMRWRFDRLPSSRAA